MTDYYTEARALLDPEHAHAFNDGSVYQPVSLILVDCSEPDGSYPLRPSAVTLRIAQARRLAGELLLLADEAEQMRRRA